jgi:hypothetical protein
MKSNFLFFKLSILISGLLLFGCEPNEIVFPGDQTNAIYYKTWTELTETPVEVDYGISEVIVKTSSNKKWKIIWPSASDSTWCKITPREGSAYAQVSLSISANPIDTERTTRFVCKQQIAPNDSVTIPTVDTIFIIQKAAPTTIEYSAEELLYGVAPQAIDLKIISNTNWTASIVPMNEGDDVTWCNLSAFSGTGDGTVNVRALTYNTTGAERFLYVKIVTSKEDKLIKVTQKEKLDAALTTISDSKSLTLSWSTVIGASGYELNILNQNDNSLLGKIVLPGTTTNYDLTNVVYPDNYIGKINLRLDSYIDVSGGQKLISNGNSVAAHSHFDMQSGDGSVGSEYIISNARHLVNVRKALNKQFKQVADIDMTDVAFEPVSSGYNTTTFFYEGEFIGTFDAGKGSVLDALTGRTSDSYSINNLTINVASANQVGLFATVGSTGVVRNLKFGNCGISANTFIGAVAGVNKGTVVGCQTVDGGFVRSMTAVGNLTCNTGGIVGANSGKISYCKNNAQINQVNGNNVGGLIGFANTSANISHCINTGAVFGKGQIGGIIGRVEGTLESAISVTLSYCSNNGVISGQTTGGNASIGGIIAGATYADLTIEKSYNAGAVSGAGSCGGILGRYIDSSGLNVYIKDCYNTALINNLNNKTSGQNTAAGIMSGRVNGTSTGAVSLKIQNCYNTGKIESASLGMRDGIAYYSFAPYLFELGNCVALDTDETNQSRSTYISTTPISGSSYTFINASADNMKQLSTYVGWDFSSVWQMESNGYPQLQGMDF